MENLKLITIPDIQIGVNTEKGIIPVVVKRKIVIRETEKEIKVGGLTEKENIKEYIGILTYIPDNPFQDIYTLNINIDVQLFFVDAVQLFLEETKGCFRIPTSKRLDFFQDTLLVKDLGFVYKDGVYTYKST